MGFMILGPSSSLLCQDVQCTDRFPDRPALCPRIGKASGSFQGKAFIVCDKQDVHADQKAWFGVWPAGVIPPRSGAYAFPKSSTPPSAGSSSGGQHTTRRSRAPCNFHDCKGFTAKACPYRRCATHCRQAGGCNTHKVPRPSFQPLVVNSLLQPPAASSAISQYQDTDVCEEDALAAALEISRLQSRNELSSSSSTPSTNAAPVEVPTPVGSSAVTSVSHASVKSTRPKISSQLGGAWLAVIDADAADEVEKERLLLAKAEAASEAKKSVDVMWYDRDFAAVKLLTFQGKKEMPEYPQFNASRHLARFGSDITSIEQYSDIRGGWVSVALTYLFTVKDGKPIVIRRAGIKEIPSFDQDWARANRSIAPTDYHAEITRVRQSFRADVAQQKNASTAPPLSTHPSLVSTSVPSRESSIKARADMALISSTFTDVAPALPSTSTSGSDSEIEVYGNVHFTPTGTSIPFLKRAASHGSGDGPATKRSRFVPSRHSSPLTEGSSPISSPSVPPRIKRTAKQDLSGRPLTERPGYAAVSPPPPSPPLYFPSVSPYGPPRVRSVGRRSSTSSFHMRSPSPSSRSPSARSSPSPPERSRPRKEPLWHQGLYCVEFAEGLDTMARSKLLQKGAFHEAFPDRPWVRRTFQDNKKQWLDMASPSDRSAAVAAGQTAPGLWSHFSRLHLIAKTTRK